MNKKFVALTLTQLLRYDKPLVLFLESRGKTQSQAKKKEIFGSNITSAMSLKT